MNQQRHTDSFKASAMNCERLQFILILHMESLIYFQIMNERDILGTQLVRRNDELSSLYEKIKILQSTLYKGEAQYAQRLEDIRLLKLEIKKLR
jgi:hypothetical protein